MNIFLLKNKLYSIQIATIFFISFLLALCDSNASYISCWRKEGPSWPMYCENRFYPNCPQYSGSSERYDLISCKKVDNSFFEENDTICGLTGTNASLTVSYNNKKLYVTSYGNIEALWTGNDGKVAFTNNNNQETNTYEIPCEEPQTIIIGSDLSINNNSISNEEFKNKLYQFVCKSDRYPGGINQMATLLYFTDCAKKETDLNSLTERSISTGRICNNEISFRNLDWGATFIILHINLKEPTPENNLRVSLTTRQKLTLIGCVTITLIAIYFIISVNQNKNKRAKEKTEKIVLFNNLIKSIQFKN